MDVERAVGSPVSDAEAPHATQSSPRPRHATLRLPIPAAVIEVLLAAVCAVLASGVVQLAVGRLDIPMPSNAPTAIAAFLSLLIVSALASMIVGGWRRWPIPATAGMWVALAVLTTLALALPLQGTQYYLGGTSFDQLFRIQYLTRLTDSVGLLDMNYVDTAPYYPSGWFWLGGRFANFMGLDGWEAYKPWSLPSMASVSAVSFSLWSIVVRRPEAALLALATALVGLGAGAVEPYAWMVAGLLPPVGVIALKAFRSNLLPIEEEGKNAYRGALVGVGVFLGIAGAVYTLHFGFASLFLLALAMTVVFQAKRIHGLWPSLVTLFLRLLIVAVVAIPLVLLVWTPFLWQALNEVWPGTGAAPRYLPEASALLPFPMLEFSVHGLVSLVGFGWLLLRFQSNDTARALGVMVLACYAWFVLSTLALIAETTLLPWRILVPLSTALACAGVLGGVEGAQAVLRRLPPSARPAVTIAATLLAVIAVVSVAQAVPQVHQNTLLAAHQDYYPTGVNAYGEEDRRKAGAWYDELHETIVNQTGQRPRDLVVLSNDHRLLALHPYWGFQHLTAHYANPLADYDGRLAEVERWAEAEDSVDFLARLDESPYRPPTVFVLEEESDGYYATLTRDSFPKHPNVERFAVVFNKNFFSDDHFSKTQIGPFFVLIRH